MTGFVIDERLDDEGRGVTTALVPHGDEVTVAIDGAAQARLSALAVIVVLRRYGRALDPSVATLIAAAPRLPLPGDRALVRLHWRAAVDAIARDWLVLVEPGREPVAALAPTVGAAIRHLAGVTAG